MDLREALAEKIEDRRNAHYVWIFMGEGNPARTSRKATLIDTPHTLEGAQTIAKRINEICEVARAVVQGPIDGHRVCVNCSDDIGSRYHEVACDPRGNQEDRYSA